ncbi:MAG: fatty acid desaturase [Actinomycetes bacterium]
MDTVRAPGTMEADPTLLPDALPTATLGPTGRPTGALRDELYRIPDLANIGHVVGLWIQSVGVLWLAAQIADRVTSPWRFVVWVAAFLLMGRAMVRFSILGHEAAHRLLFTNRRANDLIGGWLTAYPAFVPLEAYRRGHMAHHKEEFGPNEPDIVLYAGYPITRDSWNRKLRRDADGETGWKNLKLLLNALRSSTARGVALRIVGWQVVLFVGLWALTSRWWVYPIMWFVPWMTEWRILNRLRAVAEHGGLRASKDRRITTHHVEQSWLPRFWMVPFNTGWHLAHHVDIGVPFSKLPRLHRELVDAGYVQPGLSWPTYRSLWRHAASRTTSS